MSALFRRTRHPVLAGLGFVTLGLLSLATSALRDRAGAGQSSPTVTLPPEWVKSLKWRGIGPAAMSGRITAVSVYEADPSIYYAATASGGLLKTTNNGVTFQHQFDREATVSLGAVCVAPSNPNIVWVGTGEDNPRNSVSYGDGVYKSTDGGKTWQNMGLKKTYQIGAIAIHPKDPDVVYVGALGRLYGPNPERGLFKTTDGGRTWDKVHYVDEKTSVIEIAMHPTDPDTLLVAAWERRRDEFDSFLGGSSPAGYDTYDPAQKWGPGAGIYRTTDGGKTFKKMTAGLPTSNLGRIGLDYSRKDPKVVYAVVDCERIGIGTPPKVVLAAGYLGAAAKAGLLPGDTIRDVNNKQLEGYDELLDELQDYRAGDKLTLEIRRDQQTRTLEVTLGKRPGPQGGVGGPGGPKKDRPYHAYYGGQKENVQDLQGTDGFQYGGVYKSTDGGETWARVNSLNPRPMYFSRIRVDPQDDRLVYVLGVLQYRSRNGGQTFRPDAGRGVHADAHALWIDPRDGRHMLIGTDGGLYASYDRARNWDRLNHMALGQFYHVAVSMQRPYWVYGGLQDNGSWGGPSLGLRGSGPVNEDWLAVGGGDGFVCRVDPTDPDLVYYESQNGVIFRRNLRTGERGVIRPVVPKGEKGGKVAKAEKGEKAPRGPAASPYRFNWNTPFILSHHNPRLFYSAGNFVFRSLDRGKDLRIFSPEVTLTKRGSATALAESPKNPEVLWVGTDDGGLWVTRDGGKRWTNQTAKVGLPGRRWVATVEASRFAEGRAYVAFDGHRSDDDRPYVYVTEDHGETWKSLAAKLPEFGSTRCLREDVVNPDLLYLGTEFAVFASLDRGASWARLNNNLPTVAIHEIAVHPTAGEIVAATHGRSLWILDVTALRQVTPKVLQAKVHLYRPKDAVRWRLLPATGGTNRRFVGQNPLPGAQLDYSLTAPADKVTLKVVDIDGKVMREAKGPTGPGLHRVTWDLSRPFTKTAPKQGAGKGRFPGLGTAPQAPPGDYRVVLTVDGQEFAQRFRVEADPNVPRSAAAAEEDD